MTSERSKNKNVPEKKREKEGREREIETLWFNLLELNWCHRVHHQIECLHQVEFLFWNRKRPSGKLGRFERESDLIYFELSAYISSLLLLDGRLAIYISLYEQKKINYRYKSPAISERFFFLGYYFFPSFFTIFLFYYLSMHPSSSQVQRGRPVVVGTDARKLIHPSPSTPAPLHPSIHLSIHSFIRFSSCAPFSHVENSGKRDGDGKRKKNKNLFNYRSFIL